MSFNSWNKPFHWPPIDYDVNTWRPYSNNEGGGVIRRSDFPRRNENGWNNRLSDPYFSRSYYQQIHASNYERNRMHLFSQSQQPFIPPPARPSTSTQQISSDFQMNEFARQKLLQNSHVPGLKTGQRMRNDILKRRKEKESSNNQNNLKGIKVKINVSSEQIELRWEHDEKIKKNIRYEVICTNIRTKVSEKIEKGPASLVCELKVAAGEKYKVEIICRSCKDFEVIGYWFKEIRAEFSYSELKQLYSNCLAFVTKTNNDINMHEFWCVYRCKPKVYWDEIHYYYNDVMQKYIKDDNGQPGNLINGAINGLFFSARLLQDLTLPPSSPFGNVRMVVDAFHLLDPRRYNFYFADFYCNRNMHYVTIVICTINSSSDRFCGEKLIKLNPLENPFVKLVPPAEIFENWRFFVNYSLWVELYYTEDVELNMGHFSAITATGAGTSRIGGLPNNKQCTLCNLYPTTIAPNSQAENMLEKNENMSKIIDSTDETIFEKGRNSTMAVILGKNKNADQTIAQTICDLVEKTEEKCLGIDEYVEKLDYRLIESVKKMNEEIKMNKKENIEVLNDIAKNLTDFVNKFTSRRNETMEKLKKLKGSEDF